MHIGCRVGGLGFRVLGCSDLGFLVRIFGFLGLGRVSG